MTGPEVCSYAWFTLLDVIKSDEDSQRVINSPTALSTVKMFTLINSWNLAQERT
jgi:hypothetical protein